jgi:hypothetical protein
LYQAIYRERSAWIKPRPTQMIAGDEDGGPVELVVRWTVS